MISNRPYRIEDEGEYLSESEEIGSKIQIKLIRKDTNKAHDDSELRLASPCLKQLKGLKSPSKLRKIGRKMSDDNSKSYEIVLSQVSDYERLTQDDSSQQSKQEFSDNFS